MVPRLFLVLALAIGTLSGCSRGDDTAPAPTAKPTPIERLNTAAMVIPRIDFCSLVPDDMVAAALALKPGATKWKASDYQNGDPAPLTTGGEDVVAEHLCEWADGDANLARAWVFARPVKAKFAKATVTSERRTKGCTTPQAAPFGNPSVLQVCEREGAVRVRHAGLFADTWLACEVTSPASVAEVSGRADTWCSQLVSVLNTSK